MNNLTNTTSSQDSSIANAKNHSEVLAEEVISMEEIIEDLDTRLTEANDELETTKDELKDANNKVQELENKLENANNKISSLEEQVRELS